MSDEIPAVVLDAWERRRTDPAVKHARATDPAHQWCVVRIRVSETVEE